MESPAQQMGGNGADPKAFSERQVSRKECKMRRHWSFVAATAMIALGSIPALAAGQSGTNSTGDCAAGSSNTTKTADCAIDQSGQKAASPGSSQTNSPASHSGNSNAGSSGSGSTGAGATTKGGTAAPASGTSSGTGG